MYQKETSKYLYEMLHEVLNRTPPPTTDVYTAVFLGRFSTPIHPYMLPTNRTLKVSRISTSSILLRYTRVRSTGLLLYCIASQAQTYDSCQDNGSTNAVVTVKSSGKGIGAAAERLKCD